MDDRMTWDGGETRRPISLMYGTYNIQPTSDTENRFPLIAPGLPKKLRDMHIGKEDL